MEEVKTTKKQQPLKIRGTATINADNSFDFVPSQQGEPVQRSIRKQRKSKIYETSGVDKQSMVCHLVVDKQAVDPVAEMYDDFKTLVKDVGSAKLPHMIRGRKLFDGDGLTIVANANGRLQVQINVDIMQSVNLTETIINHLYKTTQCLASNETYFVRLRSALAKTSSAASATRE